MRSRRPLSGVVRARTHTPTHSDQSRVPSRARMLASPPTRASSRRAAVRASGVDRSAPSRSGSRTSRVRSSSPAESAVEAMETRTSVRKSSWSSQTRRITDALVSRTPVVDSTWSKTRLKVRGPAPTSSPSSSRTDRPAATSRPANSWRLRRGDVRRRRAAHSHRRRPRLPSAAPPAPGSPSGPGGPPVGVDLEVLVGECLETDTEQGPGLGSTPGTGRTLHHAATRIRTLRAGRTPRPAPPPRR